LRRTDPPPSSATVLVFLRSCRSGIRLHNGQAATAPRPSDDARQHRTITFPPSVTAELRAHWKAQQEQRLALGLGKAPDDALVFPTFDGRPRSPNALTKEWTVAMSDTGLKVTLHALRHTHASSLIAAGIDVLAISRRLGHASPTITLGGYGHLFSNTDDRAAQVVEAMFAKVRAD
jgi:integrase